MNNRENDFDALVSRHRDMIWHICSDYSLSNAWQVEDAVQEVLCVLWRDFDQFSHLSSERTWIYRVASNTMISLKRRMNNQPQTPLDTTLHDSHTTPDENYNHLLQLIDNLAPQDRQIVRAHLDGFQNQEIAAITGLSLSTIGRRLAVAKTLLRNQYEKNR